MPLEKMPRLRIAALPTPLDEAPRLSAALGGPRILIKRDDLTGLAFGGNKTRKLEYLMADARRQDADVVLTVGAAQSNHARQTAAAACRLGLRCILVLSRSQHNELQGNLLLDELLGVDLRFAPEEMIVHDQYVGPGYAIPTPASSEAVRLFARTEGIVVDPVYTAKAAAGMIDHIRQRRIRRDQTVVFLHTGGTPALFAYGEETAQALKG